MKILFVTTRNISSPDGELRLIKNRATALNEKWAIETEFYALLPENKQLEIQEEMNAGVVLNSFNYNLFNLPQRYLQLNKAVRKRLASDKSIKAVVISGTLLGAPLLKTISLFKNKVKIILDLHGAIEEFLEYPSDRFKHFGFNQLLYKICDAELAKALKIADGTLIVSNEMAKHLRLKYSLPEKYLFFTVPCGVCMESINLEYALESRKKWRDELGIREDEFVFVYSGGASKWQKIKETIMLYNLVKARLNAKTKLLIMTNSVKKVQEYILPTEQDIIIKSFSPENVQEVLYACDIGMLLRDECVTNKVAFPNKFSEYMAGGLEIICSKALKHPAALIKEYNIGFLYSEKETNIEQIIAWLNEILVKRQKSLASTIEARSKMIGAVSFNNTLKEFVDWLSCDKSTG